MPDTVTAIVRINNQIVEKPYTAERITCQLWNSGRAIINLWNDDGKIREVILIRRAELIHRVIGPPPGTDPTTPVTTASRNASTFPGAPADLTADDVVALPASALPVGTIAARGLDVYVKTNPGWWYQSGEGDTAIGDVSVQTYLDLGAHILRYGYGDGT